jgi:hypothetical protein
MKYARIINNIAYDVRAKSPVGCFAPNVADEFVQVPDEVQDGWLLTDGAWSAPESAPETPPPEILAKMSPIHFKMCFTPQERIACYALRATDPVIDDALNLLDDPRTTEIDMNLGSNQALLSYLVTASILDPSRVTLINAGTML